MKPVAWTFKKTKHFGLSLSSVFVWKSSFWRAARPNIFLTPPSPFSLWTKSLVGVGERFIQNYCFLCETSVWILWWLGSKEPGSSLLNEIISESGLSKLVCKLLTVWLIGFKRKSLAHQMHSVWVSLGGSLSKIWARSAIIPPFRVLNGCEPLAHNMEVSLVCWLFGLHWWGNCVIMVQVGHGFISINPVLISDGVRQCGNKRLELNHGAGDSI